MTPKFKTLINEGEHHVWLDIPLRLDCESSYRTCLSSGMFPPQSCNLNELAKRSALRQMASGLSHAADDDYLGIANTKVQ